MCRILHMTKETANKEQQILKYRKSDFTMTCIIAQDKESLPFLEKTHQLCVHLLSEPHPSLLKWLPWKIKIRYPVIQLQLHCTNKTITEEMQYSDNKMLHLWQAMGSSD